MTSWDEQAEVERGTAYDDRWARLKAAGAPVHGEADLIESLLEDGAASTGRGAVLDAGCGTGRVAVELARRGVDVVGVDLDAAMLDVARGKDPAIEWRLADLAALDLGRTFDLVAVPGNVMIFLTADTEARVVASLAAHLRPGGLLVAGFMVAAGRLPLEHYDRHAADAGLELVHRWATWDRAPYAGGNYAVSVHRRP